jgi:GT2 family glycosyltransferase
VAAVEVVVPHLDRSAMLERLLRSLEREEPAPDVCVVDNGAGRPGAARLARRPGLRVLAPGRNLGFARAVNAGIRTSAAEHVITLNDDMEVQPGFVRAVLTALRAHPGAAVGAVQLRPDGRVDSLGVALDQSLCAYDVGHGLAPAQALADPLQAIGPSGGAAAFARWRFLELGGYDERFFAYLEDADLALRLAAAGVPYVLARDAVVWHRHSATLGSGSRAKNELMGAGRGLLLAKYGVHLRASARRRGALVDGVVYAGQAVIDRNLGAVRGRRAAARMRPRPPLGPPPVGLTDVALREALRRRLGRRRP